VAEEYFPALQISQVVALAADEYFPEGHVVQSSLPVELLGAYFPAVQASHSVAPAAENSPAEQVSQSVESEFTFFPAGHCVQVEAPL
jgi:hypothetical protein